jgi:hypothetical protein
MLLSARLFLDAASWSFAGVCASNTFPPRQASAIAVTTLDAARAAKPKPLQQCYDAR